MKYKSFLGLAVFCLIIGVQSVLAMPNAPSKDLPFENGPWVVRAYYEDLETAKQIRDWTEPWTINRAQQYLILEVHNLEEYQKYLDSGLLMAVDDGMTHTYFRAPLRSTRGADTIPGFPCYGSVENSYQRMDDLADSRPDLVQILDIGDSWEKVNPGSAGFDIRVIKISNTAIAGSKPVLFAMGSIHAREYTPAETVTRFAEYLVDQYNVDPDVTWIVDHHEIHLLVQGNPDGRKMAETGLLWRKTTNQTYCGASSNSRGADINRNFPFKWGGTGSSGSECSEIYRGPVAESEFETMAINNYIASIFPDQRGPNDSDVAPDDTTGVYLDVHSFSQVVIWPWGWGAPGNSPNNVQLRTLGRRFAFFNNYTPMDSDSFGAAAGASDDNAYGQLGIAAYTFELGTDFFQNCSTFENSIFPDNLQALIYAARVPRTPYLTPSGPDIITPMLSGNLIDAGDPVTVSGQSSDTRFNNSNGTEPTQAIAAVSAFIDTPPWQVGANAIMLTAADGVFDTSTEDFTGALDTTGLGNGRHMVYLQSIDAAGSTGPVYARFLDVIDTAQAGTISGTVRDELSNAPIQNAIVSTGTFSGVTAVDGRFSFLVIPDTYDLTITASDYDEQVITSVIVSMGQTVSQEILLQPICELFHDDIESGNQAWISDSPWAISPEMSFSPSNAWSDSPGGNYGDNLSSSLTSQAFDFSNVSGLEIRFQSFCDTEATFDFGHVEISVSGGAFNEVFSCDGGNQWQQEVVGLSQFDGQGHIRIRFRLSSDVAITRDGWHLDDITIRGAGSACGLPFTLFSDGFEG